MQTPGTPWKSWQKVSFRFFFIFFGITSTLCWVMTTYFAYAAVAKADIEDQYKLYKPFSGFFHWLDKHIYHTGYDPKLHVSLPVDNHYGVVYYITIFFGAIIAAISWGIIDKKRINYDKLSYWFNVYLRYTLAVVILGYGIDKVIPVQMSYPRTMDMIRLFGNQSKEDLLWKFMGSSPGYMIFTGSCEIIAAILLFSRRTAVFGYLFTLCVLTNVLALNWFYNISVKFFSSLLWLYALYLLAPWLAKVFQFFFSDTPVTTHQGHYTFEKKWKRNLLFSILVLVPVLILTLVSFGDAKTYRKETASARKEKKYNVTAFVTKDTLAADSFRWKRVLFVYDNFIVILNMKDKEDWYQYDIDSLKKHLVLRSDNKSSTDTLQYNYPAAEQLRLSGKWKGKNISVLLKLSPVDSMYLKKEKIKIMQD